MAPSKRLSNKEIGLKQRTWVTHEILEIMNERDDFHKQYIKERDLNRKAIIFRIYKSKRNVVVKNIRQSRDKYYSEFFEQNKIIRKKHGKGSVILSTFKKSLTLFLKKFCIKMSPVRTVMRI